MKSYMPNIIFDYDSTEMIELFKCLKKYYCTSKILKFQHSDDLIVFIYEKILQNISDHQLIQSNIEIFAKPSKKKSIWDGSMAPGTYVAEDCLIWNQWEGRSLVLWRLYVPV